VKVERTQRALNAWGSRTHALSKPRKVNAGHTAHNQDSNAGLEERESHGDRDALRDEGKNPEKEKSGLLNITV